MGIYINPRNETKEAWLVANGSPMPQPKQHRLDNAVAVCLVNNGAFTAAGVAFSQRELEAFAYNDGRAKRWFQVPVEKLVEVGAIQSADDIEEEA